MKCPLCFSPNSSFFAEKNGYQFFRCGICKTLFLRSLPSLKKLTSYYARQFSYQDGLLNEKVIRKRNPIILHKIKQYASHAITLCDVGSGFGFFLDDAQKNGYTVIGVEPSITLSRHSKKMYGVQTYRGDLVDFGKNRQKKFDVVTCIHVIEHVRYPKKFMQQLLSIVKPGGLLYIETPNSDSHLLLAEKENYTFLIPPDHLWVLSRFSIQSIMPEYSSVLFTHTYSYSEHFMGIVKKIISRVIAKKEVTKQSQNNTIATSSSEVRKKKLFYFLFDCLLAPVFTPLLNRYHKGSILELYIKKKSGKSGL